ncbi:ER lumen protein-retaining receptor 3-like [Phymastichus coffea]|uniref:ER lumen protein-retaining receptor 3-like n=1 Tax=Phymastichus coffea TaxID=108790 RepID=UPI00273C340C|nr:ER lumen protein-retaining receptor 3-like [Phymastichus coffea]
MKDFQNIGVVLQLAAMLILLIKIVFTRNCSGLSGRTQILHALAFSTRFLDLPDELEVSILFFALKIVYLLIAYMTVAVIFIACRRTYEQEYDAFRIDYLVGACLTAAIITSYKHLDILSILWYFSVYLETFAILPQIFFTRNADYAGSSLVFYVGLLACYRLFDVVHWGYGIWTASLADSLFVVVNGTLQLLIYCGYFSWMVPLFQTRYDHLRDANAMSEVTKVSSDVTSNGIKNTAEY